MPDTKRLVLVPPGGHLAPALPVANWYETPPWPTDPRRLECGTARDTAAFAVTEYNGS